MYAHKSIFLIPLLTFAACARADFDSGSDGSDGAFNPTSNIEVDLDLAATATWNIPSPVPGQGVYDLQQWAVVFKYSTINIPAGVTVTFKNHRSGAPVVWMAQSDVEIAGEVSLDGERGHYQIPYYSEGGPGGFGGTAIGNSGAGGFGPAGGNTGGSPGSYAYGNESILPLIGGSGGGVGGSYVSGSGAGGGAILCASSTLIHLSATGYVHANGGSAAHEGKGSGGGIRTYPKTSFSRRMVQLR